MTTSKKITGILLDSLVFSAQLLFGVVLFFSITIPIMRSLQRSLGITEVHAEELHFDPQIPEVKIEIPRKKESSDYKVSRLQEMADLWKGTSLEKHTVPLLSMLLQEDGTLTAERRHDCSRGVCMAFGLQGHHICYRGTPIVSQAAGKPFRTFCTWKNGKSPQQQFEEEYPGFSFNWRIQFSEFTVRMVQCIDSGASVKQCIQSWNSLEVGRVAKVKRHEAYVKLALAE